jgi:hypothetical protein
VAATFDALRANLDQPLSYPWVKALPWKKIPAGATSRETGHGHTETRVLKAAHLDRLAVDLPHAQQATKLIRWRQDTGTGEDPMSPFHPSISLGAGVARGILRCRIQALWGWGAMDSGYPRMFGFGAGPSKP